MVNFSRTLVAIQNQDCVEAVFINTTNDSLVEAAEQFSISLTSNSFIVAITNSSLLVTIAIDDCKYFPLSLFPLFLVWGLSSAVLVTGSVVT